MVNAGGETTDIKYHWSQKRELFTLQVEDELICHITRRVNECYCHFILLFTKHACMSMKFTSTFTLMHIILPLILECWLIKSCSKGSYDTLVFCGHEHPWGHPSSDLKDGLPKYESPPLNYWFRVFLLHNAILGQWFDLPIVSLEGIIW